MNFIHWNTFELVLPPDKFDQSFALKHASEKHLLSLLAECVKVVPPEVRKHKLPRIHGILKHFLLSFIDFDSDLGVSRKTATNRIIMRIKMKTGFEMDEKVINALLANWTRESREKFGAFNDDLFEGLERISFKNIDEDCPLLPEGRTVFQIMGAPSVQNQP